MSDEIEVSNLVTKITVDDTGVEQSMAALGRQMKVVQSEFAAASSKLGEYAKEQEGLKTKADSLSKQLEIQGQRVAKLKQQHEATAAAKGADARETQNLEIKLNKAVAQYNKLHHELNTTTEALNKQTTAWEKASKAVDEAAKKMEAAGRQMNAAGQALTMTLTAPILGVGVASTKASIDFESAFAGVRKTVDATEEEFQRFSQEIRDMSKEIPQTATAIAGVAEAAGQLGIKNEAIMGFTRTMSDLGVATNMSSEQAATALARLANITQMPQENFDRLGATIVDLGNNLATTEAEIVEMGLRLAGAGKQIGLTEAQILALAGSLSSVGIEAEAGGSAFSRVMIEMSQAVMTGSGSLNTFASVAGMSADQFKTAFQQDAAGALISFIEGLGKMSAAGENTFAVLDDLQLSEIRVRDALLRASNAGDLFRNSMELGTRAWEENTALTNEASQRYETTASQLQILGNRIVDAAITLGDALVPALMAALDALEPLFESIEAGAQWFANLDPEMQRTIITILGMAAAAGPLLIVAGQLTTSISSLIPVVKLLGTEIKFLAGTPIGLAAVAAAGLIDIFVQIKSTMEDAKRATEELAEANLRYQEIQQNGITRDQINQTQEEINKLEELTETYQKFIEIAAESNEGRTGRFNRALILTAEELGVSFKKLQEEARYFGVELQYLDENGKMAAASLDDLVDRHNDLTEAIKDAQKATAAEINDQAKQIAVRQQEVRGVNDLLKTYKSAKQGSDEWTAAHKELARQFPQFVTATGLNVEAIEGLILVKQQEIQLEWASIQVKAQEALQEKQTAIAKQESAIKIAESIQKIAGSSGIAESALARMNDELTRLRGEAASLQALLDMKPEDFKFEPIIIPSVGGGNKGKGKSSGKKSTTTKSKSYSNEALDEAYKQLEHKKRLDKMTLESELETLQAIQKAHVKTADERMAIEEKIYDVKKQIAEREKELRKDGFEYAKQQLQAAYEDMLAREGLSAEERLKLEEGLTQEQILLHKEYINQIKDDMQDRFKAEDKLLNDQIWSNKNYLEKILADNRYSAAEKRAIEREITEEIRKATNERLKLQKEYHLETLKLAAEEQKAQVDNINNFSKAVQDALKAKYQAERKAEEERLKAEQQANEEWKRSQLDAIKTVYNARVLAAQKAADAEIERINAVYNAQIEAIQKELDALNQAEKQRSREELDAEDQKKIDRLSAKIEYEHDDFNRKQLQDELNKVIAEMNERHRQQELEDKKEALKEEQSALKKKLDEETQAIKEQLIAKKEIMAQEYEAQQANINAIYAAQKASLDQQLADTQAHYNKLLEAKSLQAEAEKMIIQNQQEEILVLLDEFGEGYQAAGQTLGEKLVAGFKPKVDEISSMIAGVIAQIDAARSAALALAASPPAVGGGGSGSSGSSSGGGGGSNSSTPVIHGTVTSVSKGDSTPSVRGTVVSVTNNFNSPVTSPSAVSAAATKTAQRLAGF
ncbi:phage tail tape measure protein [Paenibacillus ihumii]|uniref:phage tail tape measure protein n=1 Tax=Paenibacillus ihumii TaxID=687436 RepID=UPI0006D82241|nr:phage tail tape measure protein [Paenibacillus ihumii]